MHYDLTPDQLAEHHARFVTELGVRSSAAAAAPPPSTSAVVERCATSPRPARPRARARRHLDLLFVPFEQDTSFLIIGERTNANGSKKFREAMLEGDWDTCVQMAKDQVARAPTCSTCASTTWAATAPPTWTRSPAASPPRPPCRW
jgi:5-methyltetrahydrofolate--homocysteine methyltransferase